MPLSYSLFITSGYFSAFSPNMKKVAFALFSSRQDVYKRQGLNKVEVKEAGIGSIVAISGIADIHIGDTLCSPENPEPIPFQKISEPTISMNFIVNDSPFARCV